MKPGGGDPSHRHSPWRADQALSCFSLILTGECNFECSYCYQEKDGLTLAPAAIEKALDFFFPYFARDCAIIFCGGEPLLGADTIGETVRIADAKGRRTRKKPSYSLSTNGSLIDDEILDLFDRHKFTVLLSFDGLAQDAGRKAGSYGLVSGALDRLLELSRIELHTNSVFTPATVGCLSDTVRDIVERGVPDVQISFSTHAPWGAEARARLEDELGRLRGFLLPLARRTGRMPVTNFRKPTEEGIFACLAGETRMALSPDGRLWGCHLFYDLHKKTKDRSTASFSFGGLDPFIARRERSLARTLPRYGDLRMDHFHTPRKFCGQCDDVRDCVICPADAALSSGIVGRIGLDDCQIRQVFRAEKRRLWKDIEAAGQRPAMPGRRPSRRRAEA